MANSQATTKSVGKNGNVTAANRAVEKEMEEWRRIHDEDQKQIAALNARMEQLMQLMSSGVLGANVAAQAPVSKVYNEVSLVHLVDRGPGLRTHIELSNLTIDLTTFGEERTLTLQQFEECVGKYRRWFEQGIIAPGADSGDLAKRYGLKVSSDFGIDKSYIERLGTMSVDELENFYNKLCDGHKAFIIEYWKRKLLAKSPDPKFKDMRKIEALNRISHGAMEGALLDIRTAETRAQIEAEKKK